MMSYTKTQPDISLDAFLKKITSVESFTSTGGKRYKVIGLDNKILKFCRLDGKKPEMPWSMNLEKLYEAYKQLDDFSTVNFKPFVPRTHSPARGLLLYLQLLK